MKKLLLPLIILFFSVQTFAQFDSEYATGNEKFLMGGIGLTWIDDQPYYSMRFTPDLAFGKFGLGLDITLQFNSDGLRDENFKDVTDFLSVIRYFRYGQKNDPVYAKVGALDHYTMGFGNIIHLYNNSPSLDHRKTGLVLDIDMEKFGFESIYSDFTQGGVLGARAFVRPFQFTKMKDIPIIGGIEVGASYATDLHPDAGVLTGYYDFTEDEFVAVEEESVGFMGFDLGIPILHVGVMDLDLFFNYTKMMNYGSGISTGLLFEFHGLGIVDAHVKFERRFNEDQYHPSYIDAMYEIERFSYDMATGHYHSKLMEIAHMTNGDNGFYGSVHVGVLNTFNIVGSYERLDEHPTSGRLHLSTNISPEGSQYVARAGYDKINIEDESDLFTLDERSLLFAEFGYKPMPYLLVSMYYSQTFTPIRNEDDVILGYEPLKMVEPRVTFIMPIK